MLPFMTNPNKCKFTPVLM